MTLSKEQLLSILQSALATLLYEETVCNKTSGLCSLINQACKENFDKLSNSFIFDVSTARETILTSIIPIARQHGAHTSDIFWWDRADFESRIDTLETAIENLKQFGTINSPAS